MHALLLCLALAGPLQLGPQQTLTQLPRYDRYQKAMHDFAEADNGGVDSLQWASDSSQLYFRRKGKWRALSVSGLAEQDSAAPSRGQSKGRAQRTAERATQLNAEFSPDEQWEADYKDGNVSLLKKGSSAPLAVTTDGSVAKRIRYGVASWVYGEELYVNHAMWFSPDSKYLAYYRDDESKTRDYYLGYKQLETYDQLDQEAYPKAGAGNPFVGLLVYNIATGHSQEVDCHFGDPKDSEYVYDVKWSADGAELYFYRMNRPQTKWQFCAANPVSGQCRVIVSETRKDGWVDQQPKMTFLNDGKRFLILSDRSGFHNLYLYNINGDLVKQLTDTKYDIERVVGVDEKRGEVWYEARSSDNPYLQQLHRVGLDGNHETRVTAPNLSHNVALSPDYSYFVDTAQDVETPQTISVVDRNGKVLTQLAHADFSKLADKGYRKWRRFTFPSADGKFTCYGRLSVPSDFDETKKYPVLINVYGGPESGGGFERFSNPDAVGEFGFVVVYIDGRNTAGRGRAFTMAGYRRLGQCEIDDHAAGVKYLASHYQFIDAKRVGIQGTSYGGYFSALSILRYPDVYSVACSSSPVTDWRLYDSIYTERYMGMPTPEDNAKGYDAGSCMTYANQLKGKLMLYFGTADNNVHPSNTIQLAHALELAGKRYDMTIGADRAHSQMNSARMIEYLVEHLIIAPR